MSRSGGHERTQPAKPEGPPRRRGPLGLRMAAFTLAGLALLALVFTGTLARLYEKGNPVLSREILRGINRSIGTDSTWIECDRIHGSLFGGAILDRPRLRVLTVDGPMTWAGAERLHAEYDLFQILFSRKRAVRVAIEAPTVDLRHDRRGNLVMPRFGGRKRGGAPRGRVPLGEMRVGIEVVRGALSLDRGGIRFGGIRGSAVATLEPQRTTLRVTNVIGKSEMPGRPGSLRLEGLAVVAGTRMRIAPLRVGLDRTRLMSAVDWDLARARVESSTTVIGHLDLGEAMRLLDVVPITEGSLAGEITFAGHPTAGAATARLTGSIAGEPVDSLVAEATFLPGTVRIDAARARVRQAEIQGSAVFETRGAMRADAWLSNVDPAHLPWWRLPERTPHGRLNGHAVLNARKSRPGPSADLALDLDASRLGRLEIDRATLRLHLGERGDARLDSAWVQTPGGRFQIAGRMSADTTLALSFVGNVRDLGAMDSLLAPLAPERGSGTVTGSLSGHAARPDYRLRARFHDGGFVNGLGFDSLEVTSNGSLGKRPRGGLEIAVAGLRADHRPLGTVAATVSFSDRITIERYVESVGDTTLSFMGEVRFHDKVARAVLDSVAVQVGGSRWKNIGSVEASLDGERLEISRLALDLDPGRAEVVGSIWLRQSRVDARGTLKGVDLARAFGSGDSTADLGGLADGEFVVAGRLADPDLDANLGVIRPRVQRFQGDTLAVALRYTPGLLSLDRFRLAAGRGSIALAGSVRPRFTLQDWLRSLSRRDRSWASRVELSLEGKADSLDLKLAAPVDTSLRSLSGAATVRVRAGGTVAAPTFSMEGTASGLSYHGVALQTVQFVGTYADRRAKLQRLDLTQGDATTHVEGMVPVDLSLYAADRWLRDEQMTLHIRMVDADFSVATLFVPYLASSAGRLRLTADLEGTPRSPHVTGALELSDGTVRITGRDEVLQSVNLQATFDARRVEVTKFEAVEGKRGRLAGMGWWKWVEGRKRGDYEFRVRATEITVTDRESYLVRGDGEFVIEDGRRLGGEEVPRVTSVGPVSIRKSELTMNLARAPDQQAERLPFLYDVSLDIPRTLAYRNVDCETRLEGNLTLRNEGAKDVILGSLDVSGKYYLYSNEFRILEGTIDFTSVDQIDPRIDIRAQTTVQTSTGNLAIYQTLIGPSSQLKVHLSSDDPNVGESYLWKLLTVGQFATLAESRTAAWGPDPTLPVTNYMFRNAERLIADVGFVDTIDLKSGKASSTASGEGSTSLVGLVGVGKYVTPELYVKYSQDFSSSAERKISAEYRVTRYLLLRGEQVHRPSTQNQAEQQYNLDLKVRLEY